MRIKTTPEDFVVTELAEWTPVDHGPVSVYEVRKRKLDTFDAMRLLAAANDLPLSALTYVGLKDRQGVTTQLVSVDGGRLRTTAAGVTWRYLGRAAEPLGPQNLRGNAFEVVVRDLGEAQVEAMRRRRAAVATHGIVDYFDDQRFGSLVGGQGLPGRDLVRGDFEAVVRSLLATPGARDPVPERRWKTLLGHLWGDWDTIGRKWGTRRGASIVHHLRRRPDDFAGALQRMPAKERAVHVFAYQSWVWNRSVARYLEAVVPSRKRARSEHASGTLVWLEYGADEPRPPLVSTFPLLDHTVEPEDPAVRAAIDAVLEGEGLTRARFRIDGIPGCFFKHHERPLLVRPADLVLDPAVADDRHPGRLAVRARFSLPPGAYATLVLERLLGERLDGPGAGRGAKALRGGKGAREKRGAARPAREAGARDPLEDTQVEDPRLEDTQVEDPRLEDTQVEEVVEFEEARLEDAEDEAPEGGGRGTEDGGRRTEGGGRRTEDGGRRTEDGGRRAEGGGRRTEGGGRRTDDRGPRGPRRDDRGPRRDERGPRGPRRDDRGPRFDDRGPRRDDRGPRSDDRGPRGPRSDDRGPRGPRSDDRQPRSDDRRPRSDDRGPRSGDRRPRSDDRGPRGPRRDDRGPRRDDRGPRRDDRGPRRGPPREG